MHRICFRKTDSAPLCCTGPVGLSAGWLAGWSACIHYYSDVYPAKGDEIKKEKEGEYARRVDFKQARSSRSCAFVMRYVSVYRTELRLSLRFALALRVQEVLIKREINRIRFH